MQNDNMVTEERFREENVSAEEAISANNLPEAARILVDIVQKDPGQREYLQVFDR